MTYPTKASAAPKQASPWFIFLLVSIAQFMVVLDISITNVALPAIHTQLHFSASALQWVITAYAVTFGGFLLFGGRAADLFGRRRMLLTGIIAFSIFSLLIGLSTTATELIVLRALQGLAAALMSPSALSIVLVTFKEGPDRNRALAYWTLVATGGAAAGLLLGGLLTQFFTWQWNFFINVPVGIFISAAILKYLPAHEKEERKNSLDLPGAALVTASLITLVFGFSQAPEWGWLSVATLGTIGLAVLLMIAFLFNESRSSHPLVPLSLFRMQNIGGANVMMASMYAGMLATFFMATLYMQTILHYSPVMTGLSFLPMPIILGFMSTRIAPLVARYGYKRFLILGPSLAIISLLWLSFLPVQGSYWIHLFPTFVVLPFGMGMSFMPIIAAATAGVPAHQSGLASGLITTAQQMGGALGLSILTGIAASVTASASNLSSDAALVLGYDRGILLAAGFMFFALVIGLLTIRESKEKMSRDAALHLAMDVGI